MTFGNADDDDVEDETFRVHLNQNGKIELELIQPLSAKECVKRIRGKQDKSLHSDGITEAFFSKTY